jgi:hypothetical protein
VIEMRVIAGACGVRVGSPPRSHVRCGHRSATQTADDADGPAMKLASPGPGIDLPQDGWRVGEHRIGPVCAKISAKVGTDW